MRECDTIPIITRPYACSTYFESCLELVTKLSTGASAFDCSGRPEMRNRAYQVSPCMDARGDA